MGKGQSGATCVKWCLIIVNVLVLIAGGIAIGLGVWALESDYGADEMKAITGSSLYEAGCIVVIVGGCIVFVIAIIGAAGAFFENRLLLAVYFSIMILMLIVFAVAAVLGFFFRDDLRETLEEEMEETLTNEYDVDEDGDGEEDHPSVTEIWNKIQGDLHCCGVSGGLTSQKSWYLWQNSKWFQEASPLAVNRPYVPSSCCNVDNYEIADCNLINREESKPIQTNLTKVSEENPALFHNGCIDALEDEIEDHIYAIAAIAVVVLVIMIACTFFAIYLFVQVRNKNEIV